MKKSGIYIIRNSVNSKIYIGSAVDFKERFRIHKRELLKGKHHSKHLQNFVNKHSIDELIFEIIEECEKVDLVEREQYWLDFHQSYNHKLGFNISPTAGNTFGTRRTEETKLKMSLAKKTPSELARLKAFSIGRKMSDEARAKMSLAKKGKPLTKEHIDNIRLSQRGRTHSEETKKKIGRKGKKFTEEQRLKFGRYVRTEETLQKIRGRVHSEESRKKMSESAQGRTFSEETLQKMKEGRRINRENKKQQLNIQLNA
ncbi:MAG: NUMOD3 domain-containing DNA-binding protein [Bacteroidota bacterium]